MVKPLSRQAPLVEVRIDGSVHPSARVLSIERSAGGSSPDRCVFEILKTGRVDSNLGGVHFFTSYRRDVEVILKDAPFQTEIGPPEPIFWGRYAANNARIAQNANDERLIIEARIDPQFFGVPPFGVLVHASPLAAGNLLRLDLPLVFNPVIDNVIRPNMAGGVHSFRGQQVDVFLDPDSARSGSALEVQRSFALPWDLARAIRYVCVTHNDQRYVANPTLEQIRAAGGSILSNPVLLNNHHLRQGRHLPQMLDELLEPFGFSWCVDLRSPGFRRIKIFEIGSGALRTVKLQPAGELLDREKTNLAGMDATYDFGRAINAIQIVGGHVQAEATFELVRAWSEEDDSLEREALKRDGLPAGKERVWRDWVLNEAGDYTDARSANGLPIDLDFLFGSGNWTPRRRRFLPTITQDDGGRPIGPHGGVAVRMWDPAIEDWVDIPNTADWAVQVLEYECGVRFVGEMPPEDLMRLGDEAAIQVTATIEGDHRIRSQIVTAPTSVNPAETIAYIHDPTRFQGRFVHKSSIYFDSGRPTAEVDDTNVMNETARQLIDQWNQASINATFALDGLEDVGLNGSYYRIGETVFFVEGRALYFDANKEANKHPTIMAISYDVQNQQLTLSARTFVTSRVVPRPTHAVLSRGAGLDAS